MSTVKAEKKTKLIKARILDESGDLAFGLIEVSIDDPRPAFDPKMDTLKDKKGALEGKGPTE